MSPVPVVIAAAALAGVAVLAAPSAASPPVSAPAKAVVAPLPGGGRTVSVPVTGRPAAAVTATFRWPLSPVPPVLRRFAVGPRPWSPGHRGVDLGAHVGQLVLSAGAGVVTFAGVVAGRGVVAVLHPGGVRTTYEPVSPQVRAGELVAAGAPLGSLTAGPHCTGPCLHWGALRGSSYLDPLTLLRPPAPPVLLPLAGSDGVGVGGATGL